MIAAVSAGGDSLGTTEVAEANVSAAKRKSGRNTIACVRLAPSVNPQQSQETKILVALELIWCSRNSDHTEARTNLTSRSLSLTQPSRDPQTHTRTTARRPTSPEPTEPAEPTEPRAPRRGTASATQNARSREKTYLSKLPPVSRVLKRACCTRSAVRDDGVGERPTPQNPKPPPANPILPPPAPRAPPRACSKEVPVQYRTVETHKNYRSTVL